MIEKKLQTLFAVMFLSIVEIFFICVLYYMYNIHFDVQKDNSSSQQVTTHVFIRNYKILGKENGKKKSNIQTNYLRFPKHTVFLLFFFFYYLDFTSLDI